MNLLKRTLAGAVAGGLVLTGAAGMLGNAAAEEKPQIFTRAFAEAAPPGARGAIVPPFAFCSGGDDAKVKITIRNLKTGKVLTRRSEEPDIIRVQRGTYKVKTRVTCGSSTATRSQTLKVRRESDASTISRAEYRRIHDGMTLGQVKRIVGNKGQVIFKESGSSVRFFDRRGLYKGAVLIFEDGKVTEKEWDDF